MNVRFATREDVAAWFDGRVPATMRAMVLEDNGRVLAIAGLAQGEAGYQAFSDIAPDGRSNKVALGRLAARFARLLQTVRAPVFALCNADEPTSPGLLAHLGFEDRGDSMWVRS